MSPVLQILPYLALLLVSAFLLALTPLFIQRYAPAWVFEEMDRVDAPPMVEQKENSVAESTLVDDTSTAGKKRGKRHCARFWWMYVLLSVVIAFVVVLPILYDEVPHIIQQSIDRSTVNITSMSITNPTANTFYLQLTSVVQSTSSWKPHIDAFNASVYLAESPDPFMTVQIPAITGHNGAITTSTKQRVVIGDPGKFTEYTSALTANASILLYLRGDTHVKVVDLPRTAVHYDKNATMTGFNGLAAVNVSNVHISPNATAPSPDLLANVSIPNPTVTTLELGDIILALSIPINGSETPIPIGTGTVSNALIIPGDNFLPMQAVVNRTVVTGLVYQQPEFLHGLPMQIQVQSCSVGGQDITWLSQALEGSVIRVDIDLEAAMG